MKKDWIKNVLKSYIYFYIVSFLTKGMVSGFFIVRAFPETVYLFWLLFISLGFTFKWMEKRWERVTSVSAPFFINLVLFLYAYLRSGGFPNLIAEDKICFWDTIHYLNLNILLAPVMMTPQTYYLRYLAMIFLPSVFFYIGSYLSRQFKLRFEDRINEMDVNVGRVFKGKVSSKGRDSYDK